MPGPDATSIACKAAKVSCSLCILVQSPVSPQTARGSLEFHSSPGSPLQGLPELVIKTRSEIPLFEGPGCVHKQAQFGEGYMNEADPSVLRFLIASREEVSAQQLRDDLLSMLVAGHETTGSVLTWTLYLLEQNPRAMAKVRIHTPFPDSFYAHLPCARTWCMRMALQHLCAVGSGSGP